MSESNDGANLFDESSQRDSGEQLPAESSQPTGGPSPSTRKKGNYMIPLILGAIGLLLMISPFFYSAYVDATVGRGDPHSVSSGWAFVWALYHLTPPGLILLGLAFIIGFAQMLSYTSSGKN